MALQHIRSSTLDKRPQPASLSDGQLAINTNLNAPGVFFKDSNGALVKVGPTFVGTTAPNSTPGSGGATGNTLGEQWLDTSGGTYVLKIWDGTAWRSEAGEFVNVTGDTMTGALVMDNQQQVRFRETTANGTNYIALQAPASVASDKTITLPDVTGTVVTTGDTGSVTSTMIADGTIINGDVNASAAIAGTKISPDFGSQNVTTTGTVTGASLNPTSSTVPTNGVYLPAANSVGISTNSVGRLFINSSGSVGIGTSSPGTRLSVLSADNVAATAIADFSANNGTSAIQLGYNRITQVNSAPASAFLQLGVSNKTDAIHIDGTGRVGIGTTSPTQKLSVADAAALMDITSTTGTNFNGLELKNTSGSFYVGIDSSSGSFYGAGNYGRAFYSTGAYPLVFFTNGSQRAQIDSSGRLLVGTSSASYSSTIVCQGNSGSSSGEGIVRLNRGAAVPTSGQTLGAIIFGQSAGNDGAYILGEADAAWSASNDYPTRLVFSTTADGASSPTERMRIANNGDVLIGTTTSEGRITIRGDSCGGYIGAIENVNGSNCDPAHGLIFRAGKNSGSTSSAFFSFRRPDNTVLGSITQNGTSSVAYNTSSDYRLKENIAEFVDGIARLQQLKPSRFNFIEDPGKIVDGFIAHEVQAVVPEAVTGEKDGVDDEGNPVYQGIDQSKLVPLLTAALQEAVAKIESLEARLTAAGI